MRLTTWCVLFLATAVAFCSAPTPAAADLLPGDLNADGAVNAVDFTAWSDGLGDAYSVDDYLAWQAGYGQTALSLAGAGGTTTPPGGPVASVTGVVSNGGIDWSVFFTTASPPSSIATELVLEVEDGSLVTNSVVIAPDFSEVIAGTNIINPGFNPFVNAVTEGTSTHPSVASALATGQVDGIFAPLGGTTFSTIGPHLAVTFRTIGDEGFVRFGGLTAQSGALFSLTTQTVVIPEPSATIVAITCFAPLMIGRKRAAA
ncbi:MAG: hypothetical protein AAGJ46_11410 [Planctomycetota bacterium]